MDNRRDQGGAVAIIGVACRFPGAADPAEYHDLAMAGRRMFRLVEGSPGGPLYAALLDDWIRPVSFGDLETGVQDTGPVQKLAAETAALALADAGLRDVAGMLRSRAGMARGDVGGMARGDVGGRGLWGGRAGLFIASSVTGVGAFVREQFGFAPDMVQPGAAATSSLHAVADAAAALSAGELDLAVAGGAELGLDPAWLPRRRGPGRWAAARCASTPPTRPACCPVRAAASWCSRGRPTPGRPGCPSTRRSWAGARCQSRRRRWRSGLLRAYRRAGIDPAEIQLIEGQGAGTAVGDLAELTAFAQLRYGGRATAALGAVSAGIGYTRAAAGIASLVKTALAMVAEMIPPGTGCRRQHPLIESGDALLRLPRVAEPWPAGNAGDARVRLAAVNSLGTTDPVTDPGLNGLRRAEGVHLVLGRQAEGDRGGTAAPHGRDGHPAATRGRGTRGRGTRGRGTRGRGPGRSGRTGRTAHRAAAQDPGRSPGGPVAAPAARAEPPTAPLPKIPARSLPGGSGCSGRAGRAAHRAAAQDPGGTGRAAAGCRGIPQCVRAARRESWRGGEQAGGHRRGGRGAVSG